MKKPTINVLVAAVLAGAVWAPQIVEAAKTQSQVIVSPADTREYKAITLENGITVMLVSDSTLDKSAASLSVGVGLMHDPMTQQGMAHYLEHMLFLGTERFPDPEGYNNFMTQNGGSSNAYTWMDITNYMFEINNEAFDEALDRFSDFFKSPKLYPEYTDKEKNAVNAEWSMRREMDFFGMFKLNRSMMGNHPANRFLIGNLETLGDKEGSKLHTETVEFYKKYYSANIMKVAMISNLPIKQMEQLAQKHFSNINNKKIEKPVVDATIDFSQLGKKRIHYVPNNDIKQLQLDFTIDNNLAKFEAKPNRFVSYLLGSEMPGTPAYVLKKDGLIASLNVGATPDMYGNYGQFLVDIELTDKGMTQREAITRVVMNYIDKIRKEGVDEKYFKEIKTSLNNRFRFLEKGDSFNYVSSLADEMQSYPAHQVISAPYEYSKFDSKAIHNVLKQLTPERLRVWYISKQEPADKTMHFYDGKYSIVDISKEEVASWSKPTSYALTLPKVNQLLPENFDLKTQDVADIQKPTLVHDKNGIRVWQYPSQQFANQPKGLLKVYINNPAKEQSLEAQVLLSLWSDLYNLKQSALATEASIAGMNLSVSPSNGLEINVGGFTDKQPQLFKQALNSLDVSFSEAEFTQAIDRFTRELANQEKQFPIYQLFGHFNNLISSSGYSNDDLIEAAKKLKPEDLNVFIDKVLAQNQVRIFAFGNYSKRDIQQYVKQVSSIMPEHRKVVDYTQTRYWKPQEGTVLTLKKDLDVADVAVLDVQVHPEPSLTQEARARVLQGHLRTQTFQTLRTEEQLAYAVTAIAPKIKDYSAVGFAIQTPVKSAEEMQQRFDAFKKEYHEKLNEMTDQEFAQLKNSVLVSLKEKPKNLRDEVSPIINDWYRENWSFDTRDQLIAEVEKVTLQDVKDFYQQTAMNPKAARILVQLRGSKFKDKPYAELENAETIDDLAIFHKDANYQ